MKITFKTKEFNESIQIVQNIVSSRATLPILSHISIEIINGRVQLCATDLEVAIKTFLDAEITGEGGITLPGRTLTDIVREAPGDKIEISTEEKGKVNIKSGRSFFKIMGLPIEEFPKLPDLKEEGVRVSGKLVKEIIRKTSFAVSKEEARYALNGILFQIKDGRVTTVATDGRRLARFTTELPDAKERKSVILPSKAIGEVNRVIEDAEDEIKISIGENEVIFSTSDIIIASRLIKGDFPDYEKVIPKTFNNRLILEREKILSSIKRVSLLTSEKSSALKVSLSKGRMQLSASTPEVGEASEELDISYDGEEQAIAFNPSYLIDFLRNDTSKKIYLDLINPHSAAVLRPDVDENYLYVVMPIKV